MRTKIYHWVVIYQLVIAAVLLCSCGTEAKYETEGVEVRMDIKNISAGFIECDFSTNKDAYYLIAICEPWEDFDPAANSKQFMQLALDSAYAEYLLWSNDLLRKKEFNVAPFASHSLQYGSEKHFFTGLLPDKEYWVFCFPVDPIKMKPVGALNLIPVKTLEDSNMNIHFEYRIKGNWDYIYPVDATGKINEQFPYIATTRDSITLVMDSNFIAIKDNKTDYTFTEMVVLYFVQWSIIRFSIPELAGVHYGVYAVKNDGFDSNEIFQKGHTYFTAISGYDGSFKQTTIYRFVWTGDSCKYYFCDTDSANIINLLPRE